jgi:hypothetical protein
MWQEYQMIWQGIYQKMIGFGQGGFILQNSME